MSTSDSSAQVQLDLPTSAKARHALANFIYNNLGNPLDRYSEKDDDLLEGKDNELEPATASFDLPDAQYCTMIADNLQLIVDALRAVPVPEPVAAEDPPAEVEETGPVAKPVATEPKN